MKNIKQPSVKKNFLLSTLYEILCVITPFITAPYAARVLGAANIGIYSYTSSVEMYFSLIAVMGTGSYGKREIARTRNDEKLNSKLFWEIEILSICTSMFALVGWGIFVLFVKEYKFFYLILSINIFSKMFDISWFYKGLEQFKYTVTRNTVVKLVGIVCLFVFVKSEKDLWIYFSFHVGIALLGNISMWISLPRFLVKTNPKEFKVLRHLRETMVYFIPSIATSVYTVLDKTLIGVITKEPVENGYYEQANKIIHIVKTLCFTSLNSVMSSRISYLFGQKKLDEIKTKISKVLNYILFMSIGCCFGIIGVADNFVPIFYGTGYEQVIPIVQLLSFVLVITGISTCLCDNFFTPFGLRKKSNVFVIVGAFVNLICNLCFIPTFKAIGAVIGTLVAESVITICYLLFCDHYVSFGQLAKISWKKILSAFIMLTYLFCCNKLEIGKVLVLIIQIFGGVTIYVFMLFVLRDCIITDVLKSIKKIRFGGQKK